jgi:hypothetical protein
MFIKKGISFSPEQVKMKIFEIGDGQKCSQCGMELHPEDSVNGVIACSNGHRNEISLEKTNGK